MALRFLSTSPSITIKLIRISQTPPNSLQLEKDKCSSWVNSWGETTLLSSPTHTIQTKCSPSLPSIHAQFKAHMLILMDFFQITLSALSYFQTRPLMQSPHLIWIRMELMCLTYFTRFREWTTLSLCMWLKGRRTLSIWGWVRVFVMSRGLTRVSMRRLFRITGQLHPCSSSCS